MPPMRVLVVEDEVIVGLDMQSTLCEAGFDVVGPVSTLDEAVRTIHQTSLHAAVLDANLSGQNVSAAAELLVERRIPFIVVSGYAREHLPLSLVHAPLLRKPFHADKLVAAVERLCSEQVSRAGFDTPRL